MRRWHPDAWFDRQLAHARACLAEAEREHSPREIEAAWAALTDPREPQKHLTFSGSTGSVCQPE